MGTPLMDSQPTLVHRVISADMKLIKATSLSLLFCISGCAEDPKPQDSDSGPSPDSCETLLSGVPWGEVSDFDPTFEATLNAVDFEALPESFDISGLMAIYRGGIAYALEISPEELGDTLNRDEALATGHLGRVVVAALATDDDLGIDYAVFRLGMQRYYTCSRDFPATLEGFEAVFGPIPED